MYQIMFDTSQMDDLDFDEIFGDQHIETQNLVTFSIQEQARRTDFKHAIKHDVVWKIAWSIKDSRTHGFGKHLMTYDFWSIEESKNTPKLSLYLSVFGHFV